MRVGRCCTVVYKQLNNYVIWKSIDWFKFRCFEVNISFLHVTLGFCRWGYFLPEFFGIGVFKQENWNWRFGIWDLRFEIRDLILLYLRLENWDWRCIQWIFFRLEVWEFIFEGFENKLALKISYLGSTLSFLYTSHNAIT